MAPSGGENSTGCWKVWKPLRRDLNTPPPSPLPTLPGALSQGGWGRGGAKLADMSIKLIERGLGWRWERKSANQGRDGAPGGLGGGHKGRIENNQTRLNGGRRP